MLSKREMKRRTKEEKEKIVHEVQQLGIIDMIPTGRLSAHKAFSLCSEGLFY